MLVKARARVQDRLLCLDPGQIGSGSHIPFIHPWWLQNHAINTLLDKSSHITSASEGGGVFQMLTGEGVYGLLTSA